MCATMVSMHIITAAILGIVEGLTEFLPISSTAHLTMVSRLLGLSQTPFVKTFEIAIQSGAMLAVLFLYVKLFLKYRSLWLSLIAGFLPTAIIGFAVYPFVKSVLIGNEWLTVWALIIGGAGLIWFDYSRRKLPEDTTGPDAAHVPIKSAILIGLAQCLAFVPGVSRAAATIVAGLLLKLPRRTAIEFSFLLGLPTLGAATALDLYKSRALLETSGNSTALAVGFVFAFLSAILGIKFLIWATGKSSLAKFGIYRIIVALAFAGVLLSGM